MRLRTEDSEYDSKMMIKYNYLGMELTSTGEEESKIQGRINKGNRYTGNLIHVIRSKNI